MKRGSPFVYILSGLTFVLMVSVLYMVFNYVPTERTMGIVQRIFYFHVPVAWVALLSYMVMFVNSILYLWKRENKWDIIASSSAEVGFAFTAMFLITGSIWAKPIWGVWWVWEPRLTTAFVLLLIYAAYLLVRSFALEKTQGARFAAVVGIVGFIDVPMIILAITLWRTQHPGPVIFSGGLTPPMLLTLLISVAAFTALYSLLLILTTSVKSNEDKVKKFRAELVWLKNIK